MARQGKCTNFGNCSKADNWDVIQIPGQILDCPECGGSLLLEDNKGLGRKVLWMLLLLTIAAGAWLATKSCYFDDSQCKPCEYGANADGSCIEKPCEYGANADGSCKVKPCEYGANADGSCKVKPCEYGANADGSCKVKPCEYGANADGSCKVKPCEYGANADGSCKLKPSACTLDLIQAPVNPNWYAVIEIGSKGVKPIAIEFQSIERGELIPITYQQLKTQDITPKKEASIPDVVNAICEDINTFHRKYGNLPIYLVGSSSMENVPFRPKLEQAIFDVIKTTTCPVKSDKCPVDFLNADQEVSYLSKGIWVPPLPTQRHCQSSVIDIGGNIKGGYIHNCNPNRENDPKEQLVTFEVDLGTWEFSKKSIKKSEQENISFKAAATEIRKELEEKLQHQVRENPELVNNKSRFYVVGGTPWALTTLLCLDCPQYSERSITDDIDDYSLIKPSDIDLFYNDVTRNDYSICNPDQNKYIRDNLDNSGKPLLRDINEIDKQKDEIRDVCNKPFKDNNDLISAAEIMRAIVKVMKIDREGKRKLFFMQNNLYTWSRQYLIEKIKQQ